MSVSGFDDGGATNRFRAKRRSEFGVEDEFHFGDASCACVIFSRMWEIRAQVQRSGEKIKGHTA